MNYIYLANRGPGQIFFTKHYKGTHPNILHYTRFFLP